MNKESIDEILNIMSNGHNETKTFKYFFKSREVTLKVIGKILIFNSDLGESEAAGVFPSYKIIDGADLVMHCGKGYTYIYKNRWGRPGIIKSS